MVLEDVDEVEGKTLLKNVVNIVAVLCSPYNIILLRHRRSLHAMHVPILHLKHFQLPVHKVLYLVNTEVLNGITVISEFKLRPGKVSLFRKCRKR